MDKIWAHGAKRVFDMLVVIVAIVALSPLLLLVSILVRLRLGSPVLFKQERLGKNARLFRIYKFRTMNDWTDPDGNSLPDADRMTRLGTALRRSSIDELPQLFNILNGDMSLVGPRPTLPIYRGLLMERYPRRFEVLPGLTSLPAICGRNSLPWDQKFELDVEYVERLGVKIDMDILLRTIPVVLRREGISMEGQTTATRYDQDADDD